MTHYKACTTLSRFVLLYLHFCDVQVLPWFSVLNFCSSLRVKDQVKFTENTEWAKYLNVCYRAKCVQSCVWDTTVWAPIRPRLCGAASLAEFISMLQHITTSGARRDPSNNTSDRGTTHTIPQELPGAGHKCDQCHHLAPVSYTQSLS